MALTSAHELLTTINILDPLEKEEKAKRHPKNEFQAYAYRLAHDLNDLPNLQIYMRLAKSVERSMMEKAYSFVSDSTTNQRGRLFLWKLKQIRQDIQKKRDSTNYDYSFVIAKMAKSRDVLLEPICERVELDYSENYKETFHTVYENLRSLNSISKREKPKLLILGYCSPRLLIELEMLGFKVQGIEISKKLNSKIKATCKSLSLKSKWITKDFLKNSFEDNSFDAIFLNSYWSLVPKDSEITFLKALKKVLKSNGKLVINSKVSKEEKQEWKTLKYKGNDLECFVKDSSLEGTKETLRILFDDVSFLN